MKRVNILLFLHLLILQIGWGQTDSLAIPFLNDAQQSLIRETPQITAFQVDDFKAVEGTTNLLEEFKILNQVSLDASQSSYLKETFLNQSNYLLTHKIKQCFFLPQMGFQLTSDAGTMNVLISLECRMIRFYQNGAFDLYYFNDNMSSLSDFYDGLFKASSDPATAEDIVAAPPTSNEGFSLMSFVTNSTQKGGKVSCATSPDPECQLECDVQYPIYYIVQGGESTEQLPELINDECDMSVNMTQICQLNNLSINQLKEVKKGTHLIVGYLSVLR